ncbi:hypothetical protein LT337_32585 (plasmid) [Mycolicibacterium fortuitum]|nr:hypothetical protein LT337_32585 [Mycolicibacterium fortuitum]
MLALALLILALASVLIWRHTRFTAMVNAEEAAAIRRHDAADELFLEVVAEKIRGLIGEAMAQAAFKPDDTALLSLISAGVLETVAAHDGDSDGPAAQWFDSYHRELAEAAEAAAVLIEPYYLDAVNPGLGALVSVLRWQASAIESRRDRVLARRRSQIEDFDRWQAVAQRPSIGVARLQKRP